MSLELQVNKEVKQEQNRMNHQVSSEAVFRRQLWENIASEQQEIVWVR